MTIPFLIRLFTVKMHFLPLSERRDQSGINMVDLMMWLVIAVLLLAAALQSIGFYQKNARLYQMKTEADVVASRVMAEFATNGGADPYLIDSVVASENAARPNDNINVSWGINNEPASAAAPSDNNGMQLVSAVTAVSPTTYFVKVTETNVKNSDVVYFLDSSAKYSSGVHVVAKDALGASSGPPEGSIGFSGEAKCYTGQWKASYYSTDNFNAPSPAAVRCENGDGIKYSYNLGGSAYVPGSPVDYFSTRWEKEINVAQTGNYTFTAKGDDYVYVYLDDVRILSTVWSDSAGKTATVNIPAGTHKLKVETSEGVSTANIDFKYAPAS